MGARYLSVLVLFDVLEMDARAVFGHIPATRRAMMLPTSFAHHVMTRITGLGRSSARYQTHGMAQRHYCPESEIRIQSRGNETTMKSRRIHQGRPCTYAANF